MVIIMVNGGLKPTDYVKNLLSTLGHEGLSIPEWLFEDKLVWPFFVGFEIEG
jgi:hypothetical protein